MAQSFQLMGMFCKGQQVVHYSQQGWEPGQKLKQQHGGKNWRRGRGGRPLTLHDLLSQFMALYSSGPPSQSRLSLSTSIIKQEQYLKDLFIGYSNRGNSSPKALSSKMSPVVPSWQKQTNKQKHSITKRTPISKLIHIQLSGWGGLFGDICNSLWVTYVPEGDLPSQSSL